MAMASVRSPSRMFRMPGQAERSPPLQVIAGFRGPHPAFHRHRGAAGVVEQHAAGAAWAGVCFDDSHSLGPVR